MYQPITFPLTPDVQVQSLRRCSIVKIARTDIYLEVGKRVLLHLRAFGGTSVASLFAKHDKYSRGSLSHDRFVRCLSKLGLDDSTCRWLCNDTRCVHNGGREYDYEALLSAAYDTLQYSHVNVPIDRSTLIHGRQSEFIPRSSSQTIDCVKKSSKQVSHCEVSGLVTSFLADPRLLSKWWSSARSSEQRKLTRLVESLEVHTDQQRQLHMLRTSVRGLADIFPTACADRNVDRRGATNDRRSRRKEDSWSGSSSSSSGNEERNSRTVRSSRSRSRKYREEEVEERYERNKSRSSKYREVELEETYANEASRRRGTRRSSSRQMET